MVCYSARRSRGEKTVSSAFLPRLCATAMAAALVVAAPYAQAQPREKSPRARALDLFEKSAVAYREGRFQDAIDLLVEARRVKREPVLLYDLGRAYEALGKQTEAADAYAGYLAEEPRAADRRAIEGRIATLRAQAEQLDKAKSPPSPPPEERRPPLDAPEPEPESPSVMPWVVTGVGVAGLGAGVALALVASGRHDDAVREPAQRTAHETQQEAESLATAATLAFVAGGVVTAAGLTWLGVRAFAASPAGSSSRVSLLPGLGTLTLKGSF